MSDPREDPAIRNLASFALTYGVHHDTHELHRRGALLAANHGDSVDLAELAANYQDTPEHRAELARSAREILALPAHPMCRAARIGIGCYLMILGAALLALMPWAWSVTDHPAGTRPSRADFLGYTFTPTTQFSVVALVILAALLGSVVVLTLTFSYRAGRETLDRGYVWWYLTRPITAAALGAVVYVTVVGGYLHLAGQGHASPVTAVVVGGLAGLFTDQVLEKMRSILGLGAFDRTAAGSSSAGTEHS